MNRTNGSIGICLGASTISAVRLKRVKGKIETSDLIIKDHDGDPKRVFQSVLKEISITKEDAVCVTGRKLTRSVNLTSISEPQAVELSFDSVKPNHIHCPAVISAGGETFMVYALNSKGKISKIISGNKCASGTGEFFFQQLRRMDVSVEEASSFTESVKPYQVSGRCSVFCKSDCTHATNKGIPKQEVTAGLCKMMSEKILGLLSKIDMKNIMITGGTSKNTTMLKFLNEEIKGLIVPENAVYFEAFGAARYALENKTDPFTGFDNLFIDRKENKDTLPPLSNFKDQVTFKNINKDIVKKGDICILGLDVGSTTTKAVLIRKEDKAFLASVYLRTNGDPIDACVKCYRGILSEIEKSVSYEDIIIEALGVTGSGRKIAGLHANSDGVINEIIAHATASLYFDPEVDTIFEIGGQDAKYTHISQGVPSDYAMNEACSAGTGSFLEESAFETLGIDVTDIGDIALKGTMAPNFNDQCSAFISSDIKNAIHEGVKKEDIVAGLVYSICMNYSNRVQGNRPLGEKIFMQGGVCYNKAVPLAMTYLTGKPVIVPPEPGLMGAFGVALEVNKRVDEGLFQKGGVNLKHLVQKDFEYGKPFICGGGKEKCDRKCEISMIITGGEKFPFGGACNLYENMRKKTDLNSKLDLVRLRQHLVFEKYGAKRPDICKGKIGFNKSFLVNTYFPLYSTFFSELGYEPILPLNASQNGIDERNAAFCYPAELSHGFIHTLINSNEPPNYLFLPHLKAVPSSNKSIHSQVCPFVQGESFFLKTAFRQKIESKGTKILSPLLDMTDGIESVKKAFIATAKEMGESKKDSLLAFKKAIDAQNSCFDEMKHIGRKVLDRINRVSHKKTAVLFGRPYNAFPKEANMGIPGKIASRNIAVIPFDFLPYESESCEKTMYWGVGQQLMKAAEFTSKNPNLFGIFITNFSCGPDSFIVSYFRNIMGRKPSLTLELDSHTADAGIETRIEAFFDIVDGYRRINLKGVKQNDFKAAKILFTKKNIIVKSAGGLELNIKDKRVKILFPSMGFGTDLMTSVFISHGYNATARKDYDEETLKIGRANTTGKECLPLILTTGNLLNFLKEEKSSDEVLVYFMPSTNGPCRFGQYNVFINDLIKKKRLENVALLSLNSEDTYNGFGAYFDKHAWCAIIIADLMEDIKSMLLANAKDTLMAMEIFDRLWNELLERTRSGSLKIMIKTLKKSVKPLSEIPLKKPTKEVPLISLTGEIFVRRDSLSRRNITGVLAERGFATTCSPVSEWISYTDYLTEKKLSKTKLGFAGKLRFLLKRRFMKKHEKRIKKILNRTGLCNSEPLCIDSIVKKASPFISPSLTGEAILTVGGALHDIADHTCGVIAIGPFGCMPSRLSESVLTEVMKKEYKLASSVNNKKISKTLEDVEDLPFLSIESDGSEFTQLIDAKLDAFCMQAERLHRKMVREIES
jgi:predicted CoA-substrate-specific enzyme activase